MASGGARLDDKQVRKVRALGPRDGIILAPDNDLAGLESILANAEKLKRLQLPINLYCSIPPRIEYELDGREEFTTDWNDIGRYVTGWDGVLDILNEHTQELTILKRKWLTERITELKAKSIPSEPIKS